MHGSSESWDIDAGEMEAGAMAMNRAMLDSDFREARFRARLLHYQVAATGDALLESSVALVLRLLGGPGGAPALGCGAAMLAVSAHLSDRLVEPVGYGQCEQVVPALA